MSFSGSVFDFNGTLFWDTGLHNEAWDRFIDEHHLGRLSDAEKNQRIHGKTNQEILQMLFNKELSPEELQTFNREKESIYQKLCLQQKMELAPGAVPLLDFLKTSRMAFTIATSSGINNIQFYFEHLNLAKWFDFDKVIYNNGSIKSKPDPEIFLAAMRRIHKDAREVVIFEDSFSGILAAENAHPGKIIIVDSVNVDYSRWNYQIIKSFDEVERGLFNG